MPFVFIADGSQRGRGRGGMGRGRGAMPKNKKQKGKNWGRGKGRGADPPTEGPKSARHPSAGSEVFTAPFRISITTQKCQCSNLLWILLVIQIFLLE